MSTQNNEDVCVRELFGPGYVGTAVEVGAGDGETLNNTLWMEEEGWDVLSIEPDFDLYQVLKQRRKRTVRAACADYEKDDDKIITYIVPGSAHHGKVTVLKPPPVRFQLTFMPERYLVEADNSTVRAARLDTLLEESGMKTADFVSIDVDGIEMQVLSGFSPTRWDTKVVMIEFPFDDDEMVYWFSRRRFRREHTRIGGLNDIYVREDWR